MYPNVKMCRVANVARAAHERPRTNSSFRIAIVLSTLLLAGCAKPEVRSEEHYQKAMEFIAKGDDYQARRELFDALKHKPDRIDAVRAMAGVNERTGATNIYFQNLRKIIELDPTDELAKIRLAKLMLRGAPDAALKVVESINGQDNNADFHATKATILAALKDSGGALSEARKATELDASNADAALILASERVARNNPAEALQILNRAKVSDPKDSRIALAKVQLLQLTGDLPRAEAELRTLVQANPKETAVRTQLVQVLARQQKLDEAEKELRAIVDANPTDTKFGLDLVRFIRGARGTSAARQELEARIAKGGEVFPYQMALVEIAIAERQQADAARMLERLTTDAKSVDEKNTAKVKLAEVRAGLKDLPAAERLIAEVLDADRRNVGALRLRAAIRLDRGETDAAVADLREALNEQPKAAELLLLMAQAYERNGQTELADRQYTEAARATEFNSAVVLRYVAFLQRANNQARAEEMLIESARRNQSIDILSSLAQVRLSRRNWAGALEIANALAGNEPTKALSEQIRAAALAGQNKPEESLAALEQAHASAPNALAPVVALVRAYSTQKSYDKAEKLVQDMLRKFPNSSQLFVLMGQVQLTKGAPLEAVKSFEAAIEQQPKDAVGYNALANLHARQREADQALAAIERGLKEMPEDGSLRLTKAGLLGSLGQHDAAIEIYEAIVRDQPGSLVAVNNLASMLLDYRSDKASLDRAQAMVERLRGVQVPQFLDTIGWALHLRGDHAAAKPMLEQAKAQLPNVAAVRFHLGLLYRALGEEPKASEELKAASLLETEESELKKKIRAALN